MMGNYHVRFGDDGSTVPLEESTVSSTDYLVQVIK